MIKSILAAVLVVGFAGSALAQAPAPKTEAPKADPQKEKAKVAQAAIEQANVDITKAREEIQKLDLLTVTLADLVNEVHRRGFGLNGKTGNDFFVEYPFVENLAGNYDRSGDGVFDSSYIYRLNGSNPLDPQQQIGLRREHHQQSRRRQQNYLYADFSGGWQSHLAGGCHHQGYRIVFRWQWPGLHRTSPPDPGDSSAGLLCSNSHACNTG